jgi:NAD-dependent dihydropyrimidine dehydrogenase PreA subunit
MRAGCSGNRNRQKSLAGTVPIHKLGLVLAQRRQLMAAVVDQEKCNGCGDCVEACPLEAIKIEGEKSVVDPETCGDCGACVDACPNEAISCE